MNRNTVVGWLIVATGVLFSAAAIVSGFTDVNSTSNIVGVLGALGFVTGVSAVTTRFLIKEVTNNG